MFQRKSWQAIVGLAMLLAAALPVAAQPVEEPGFEQVLAIWWQALIEDRDLPGSEILLLVGEALESREEGSRASIPDPNAGALSEPASIEDPEFHGHFPPGG